MVAMERSVVTAGVGVAGIVPGSEGVMPAVPVVVDVPVFELDAPVGAGSRLPDAAAGESTGCRTVAVSRPLPAPGPRQAVTVRLNEIRGQTGIRMRPPCL